jgi:hypothetical protein
MKEIFANISTETKSGAELIFKSALKAQNPEKMLKILNEYTNSFSGEEQDFIRFYFNLRME